MPWHFIKWDCVCRCVIDCFVVFAVVCLSVDRSYVVRSCFVTWCRVLCCCDIVRHLSSPVLYTSRLDRPSFIFPVCLIRNDVSDDISCVWTLQTTSEPVQSINHRQRPQTLEQRLYSSASKPLLWNTVWDRNNGCSPSIHTVSFFYMEGLTNIAILYSKLTLIKM